VQHEPARRRLRQCGQESFFSTVKSELADRFASFPVTWDPPVKDPGEIKTRWMPDAEIDGGG
jgi:hypothetical protein